MQYDIDALHGRCNCCRVKNITADEFEFIFKACQVVTLSKTEVIQDADRLAHCCELLHDVRSNKSCASGNEIHAASLNFEITETATDFAESQLACQLSSSEDRGVQCFA